MIKVGFWKDTRDPLSAFVTSLFEDLPDPRELAVPGWYEGWADGIADWLDRGKVASKYMGSSYCRFDGCKTYMGCVDLSDGVYLWPEGLSHYVRVHGVVLPRAFIRHVLVQMVKEGSFKTL